MILTLSVDFLGSFVIEEKKEANKGVDGLANVRRWSNRRYHNRKIYTVSSIIWFNNKYMNGADIMDQRI